MSYYKAVRSYYSGRLLSYSVLDSSELLVEYKLNEWVAPIKEVLKMGYGLFVFKSKKSVKQFIGEHRSDIKVFKVAVKNILPEPELFLPTSFLWKFEHYLNNPEAVNRYTFFPKGTVMVGAVKLLKEVII